MGYNTYYKIQVIEIKGEISEKTLRNVRRELASLSDYEEDWFDIDGMEITIEAKWYDWKKNMKMLASKYPQLRFKVEAEGENPGDIWRAFFLGDKVEVQTADITFEDEPEWIPLNT